MMTSIQYSEIFARTELQRVLGFISDGAGDSSINDEPYNIRLSKATSHILTRLEGIYPNADEMDNAQSDLNQALAAYKNVYMEIGMKTGVRLLHQLLSSNEGSMKNEQ